jgi:hypothetical protein
MQDNIEMKNSVVSSRSYEPNKLNSMPPKFPLLRKPQGSGFSREEMRRIVADQID